MAGRKYWGLLAAAAAVFGLKGSVILADVIIKAVPQETTWVADGVTEYRVDVIGDTTESDVSSKKLNSAEWGVYYPDVLRFSRAELPDAANNPSQNPADFFYNYYMDPAFNKVDNAPAAGPPSWTILTQNGRLVDNPNDGPQNVDDRSLGS